MVISTNLTAITCIYSFNQSCPINITIFPGAKDQDLINLNVTSYKVINISKRVIKIQLDHQTPGLISMKKHKDILKIIFND